MLLELDHISKIYGDLRAVDDLNLTVPEGEWLAIDLRDVVEFK